MEVDHSPQSICAKDDAEANMSDMSVTIDTSHIERSQLNDDAEENMALMSVALDTSHFEISPLNEEQEVNMLVIFLT